MPDSDPQDILARVVQDYMDAQLQGRNPDIEEMVRSYPEFEEQIRRRIRSLREVDGLFANLVQDANDAAVPAFEHDLIGRHLGDFEILRLIGRGGMGAVFLARQTSLGREVALKVIADVAGRHSKSLERFRREATVLAQLSHPHIVPIHDTGQEGPYAWFAMEYVRGVSLDAILAAVRRADPARKASAVLRECLKQFSADDVPDQKEQPHTAAGAQIDRDYIVAVSNIVIEIASALQCAHDRGILHRDVKPSNILIDSDGRAKLVDFGLARAQSHPSLTVTGEFFGTPNYVSPEQIRHPESADGRSDMYSLAATYYECLTLRRPFEGDTVNETLTNVLAREVIPPRKHSPRLAPDLSTILLHALEKQPQDRYRSIADFLADIQNVLDFKPITAKRPSATRRTYRAVRRNPRTVALALVAAVLCIVAYVAASKASALRAQREAESLFEIGQVKRFEGNYAEAIRCFEQASAKSYAYVDPYIASAGCHFSLGRYEQAADLCRRAISLDRNSVSAYLNLGLAMMGQKDLDQAKEALERAIALQEDVLHPHQPELALAHGVLALCYSKQGIADRAVAEFNLALSIDPNTATGEGIGLQLANMLSNAEHYAQATEVYQQLLSRNRDLSDVCTGLSTCYFRLQKLTEAEKTLKDWVRITPLDHVAHRTLAQFYLASNRPLDAVLAYLDAADARKKANCLPEALAYYADSLAIDPNNVMGLIGSANCCKELGRYAEAVAFYSRTLTAIPHDRMLNSAPVSRNWVSIVYAALGDCYRGLQMTQEAQAAYLHAIELKPDFHAALLGLAVTYWGGSERRYQPAIDCYLKALEIEPRDVSVHFCLGMCYYGLQRYEEAIESYQLYLTTRPGDSATWTFLASAYSQCGDFQKAIEYQEKALQLAAANEKNASEERLAAYRAGKPWRENRDNVLP